MGRGTGVKFHPLRSVNEIECIAQQRAIFATSKANTQGGKGFPENSGERQENSDNMDQENFVEFTPSTS